MVLCVIASNFGESSIWFNREGFDREILYEHKVTGERFYFDKNGIWNQEGIEHPLIN